MTADALAALKKLDDDIPKNSTVKDFEDAFNIARIIIEIDKRKEPTILAIGNLEITNEPFRDDQKRKFKEEIAKLDAKEKSIMERIYDSAQIKPSIMGIGIDLKPHLNRLARLFDRE